MNKKFKKTKKKGEKLYTITRGFLHLALNNIQFTLEDFDKESRFFKKLEKNKNENTERINKEDMLHQ